MRYEHHPDPAIAYCMEADIIEAIYHDVRIGLTRREALESRVERALRFRVGGDANAVAAKDRIREIDALLKAREASNV